MSLVDTKPKNEWRDIMSKYETPDYKVLLKDGPYEIRKYVNFFIVEYESDQDPAIQNGFRTLFKYISNENEAKEKIAMTIPVLQEDKNEKRKMAFVVPEKYSDQIPKPTNQNLKVKKFEEGLLASIRYSGFSSNNKQERMKKKLQDWLFQNNYETQSNFIFASYNAPFTPFMLRRNEVLVRITK